MVLTANVKNEDLPALKAALANRQIDAVPVSLPNNVTIEQTINKDNSEEFMAKIQCWPAFREAKASP